VIKPRHVRRNNLDLTSAVHDRPVARPGERDQLLPADRIDQRFRLSEALI
jgi:hypothetical protein